MCPKLEKVCPKLEKVCPTLEKMCPKLEKMCPKLEKMCPKLEKVCPKLEQVNPKLEKMCPKFQYALQILVIRLILMLIQVKNVINGQNRQLCVMIIPTREATANIQVPSKIPLLET